MDNERMDFKALDPWNDPERLHAASQRIVEAHRATPRRATLDALLASLAPRAVLTAALATALIWWVPVWMMERKPPATVPPPTAMAKWVEHGQIPSGLELLQIAEISDDK